MPAVGVVLVPKGNGGWNRAWSTNGAITPDMLIRDGIQEEIMSRIVLLIGGATLVALIPAGVGLAANPSLSSGTPVAPSLVRSTVDPGTGRVVLSPRHGTVEAGDDDATSTAAEPGDDHGAAGVEPELGDDHGTTEAEPGDDHGGTRESDSHRGDDHGVAAPSPTTAPTTDDHGASGGGHGSDDPSSHH
jgi:hypothetical protein